MTTKGKPPIKEQSLLPRNAVKVIRLNPDDEGDDATARTLTRPEVQAAAVIQLMEGDNHEVNALIKELTAQVAAVHRGDMSRAEAMLIAQAHTLDELFANLARRAHANIIAGYPDAADRYMRLAFKSQSQCRTTLESLAEIKNPRSVAFVRQANIANGPQQVNNGAPSRPQEKEIEQSKLSEANNELLPNAGPPTLTGQANSHLETVGAVHRTEDGRR